MTDGQFVSDDIAVACLHLRGRALPCPMERSLTVSHRGSRRLPDSSRPGPQHQPHSCHSQRSCHQLAAPIRRCLPYCSGSRRRSLGRPLIPTRATSPAEPWKSSGLAGDRHDKKRLRQFRRIVKGEGRDDVYACPCRSPRVTDLESATNCRTLTTAGWRFGGAMTACCPVVPRGTTALVER